MKYLLLFIFGEEYKLRFSTTDYLYSILRAVYVRTISGFCHTGNISNIDEYTFKTKFGKNILLTIELGRCMQIPKN